MRSIQSKTWKSGARQTREHSEVCKTKLHEGGRGCVTMQYYARGGNHKQQRKMECLLMGEGWCAVGDRNIGHKSPPPLCRRLRVGRPHTPGTRSRVQVATGSDTRLLLPCPPGLTGTGRCCVVGRRGSFSLRALHSEFVLFFCRGPRYGRRLWRGERKGARHKDR